jgi:hypothetical protein
MTIIASTFTRYDAIGVREDLSDEISNISPTSTPFMSNAKKGSCRNTFFEWQTDALASASTSNQQLEGDDIATFPAVTPTVRLGNYCEIARKSAILSDTVESVDSAGGANNMGYVVAKLGKELKRDMESSLLANKACNAGNSTTARVTGGLKAWIKTNYDKASDATIPSYTTTPSGTWTDGTARAFTETQVKSVCQQGVSSGANFSTVMVGAFNKQAFSAFSGVIELMANQNRRGQATIIGAADTYVNDFGTLSIVFDLFQPTNAALFIDWDMVEVNYLRPFTTKELAPTGDAKKRLLVVEYGLQVLNEKGLGIVNDLTTS